MALTLLFFALTERYPERRRLFLLLMYVSVGLGVLTKGPVAIALPGLVFAVYLLVHRRAEARAGDDDPGRVVLVLAIVVPWYAALYQRYGWTYITSFIRGENIARFTEGVGVESRRGPRVLPPGRVQRFVSVVAVSVRRGGLVVRRLAEPRRAPPPGARGSAGTGRPRLPGPHAAVALGPRHRRRSSRLSAAKQDLYIFPIVPAVAALGGCSSRVTRPRGGPARPRALQRDGGRSPASSSRSPGRGRCTCFSRPARSTRSTAPRSSAASEPSAGSWRWCSPR